MTEKQMIHSYHHVLWFEEYLMNDEMMARHKERIESTEQISLTALVFCLVLFLILGVIPLLNSWITRILRPLMIVVCLVEPRRYPPRLNKAILAFLFYLMYMTVILITHHITAACLFSWINVIMFGVFFIVLSQRMWSAKEIRMIFTTAFIASMVYSLLLTFYNHDLIHAAEALYVHGKKVNSNAASYTITTGALSGLILFFNYRNRYKITPIWKTILFLGTVMELYILLALGQRGGFFSVCIGGFLIIWEHIGTKTGTKKIALRVILILAVATIMQYGPKVTEDTHASRLFDYENLLDDNGRDDLNDRARQMIREKPFFGGGFDYWNRESGISIGLHNGFLSNMVIGGYMAGILVGLFLIFFLSDALHQKSLLPFAFIVLALVHFFEDTGLDYYSYIPMILAYILILNELFWKTRTKEVFYVGKKF